MDEAGKGKIPASFITILFYIMLSFATNIPFFAASSFNACPSCCVGQAFDLNFLDPYFDDTVLCKSKFRPITADFGGEQEPGLRGIDGVKHG